VKTHLITNKGHHAHAACDRRIRKSLVERVGDVRCLRCLAFLRRLYSSTLTRAA
jgi:hypothetical protein